MSEPTAPRGRGRGRGRRVLGGVSLSGTTGEGSNSPSPAPEPRSRTATSTGSLTPAPSEDVAMEDAPLDGTTLARASSVKRVPSVGIASSRTPSLGVTSSRSVGGLLGSQSQFNKAPGTGTATGKPKFRPNVAAAAARKKEKEQQYSDDDDDVKMEDDAGWKKRGPRPVRPRVELEMTASGPMAQGPGGAPRTWGARTATASGAAVMAASREGTLNAQLNQDEDASDLEGGDDDSDGGARRMKIRATDLNDIGLSDGGSDDEERKGVPPLVLPRDPKVLRTKIRRLQERKTERLKKEALKASRDQPQIKAEPSDSSMSLEGTPNATPGPSEARTFDSKESTFAGFDADEKEAKDLKDLEEEEKKEINLSEAFDLKDTNRLDLYMFQFPRKFPVLVPKDAPSLDQLSLSDSKNVDGTIDLDSDKKKKHAGGIKTEPDLGAQTSTATVRKPTPPEWGRSGTRTEKAARWSEESGKIGKLRVHRSGKVTLKIHGDLKYEVLPAAQPSFLQEIAVLDHPMRSKQQTGQNGSDRKGKGKSKSKKSSIFDKKTKKDSDDDDSESSRSANSDSDSEDDQPRWNKKDPPPESIVCIGQTSKKFIVVPEITDLLTKVGAQEKQEKEAERRAKGLKVKKEK
ncbi:DNA-directed RNA polymerase III subunit C53 [Sporobolomyces koalae]|uniref:DNA-directed RNA polymerase III subunit C53 n=1 Tax=Sporobolomyces koalae TaxID=500713 RepID=UPI003179CAEE